MKALILFIFIVTASFSKEVSSLTVKPKSCINKQKFKSLLSHLGVDLNLAQIYENKKLARMSFQSSNHSSKSTAKANKEDAIAMRKKISQWIIKNVTNQKDIQWKLSSTSNEKKYVRKKKGKVTSQVIRKRFYFDRVLHGRRILDRSQDLHLTFKENKKLHSLSLGCQHLSPGPSFFQTLNKKKKNSTNEMKGQVEQKERKRIKKRVKKAIQIYRDKKLGKQIWKSGKSYYIDSLVPTGWQKTYSQMIKKNKKYLEPTVTVRIMIYANTKGKVKQFPTFLAVPIHKSAPFILPKSHLKSISKEKASAIINSRSVSRKKLLEKQEHPLHTFMKHKKENKQ